MKKESEEAIIQIPREINKLTRVIATIGEALLNQKIRRIVDNKEAFKELVKEQGKKK